MTALLRRGWGLEGLLRAADDGKVTRKQRDDHRHHAIDAFVLACTTPGLLHKFARAAGSSHNAEERLAAAAHNARPWDGFHRNILMPFLDRLVVSHKPDHGTHGVPGKTTGQLHEETAYGLVSLAEKGPSEVVKRKKLRDFKRGDLENVRDKVMGQALLELWDRVQEESASSGGTAARFAELAATEGVLLANGRRRTVRRVRVLERHTVIPIKDHADGKPYKGYRPGGNEFADIWQMPDKRRNWKIIAIRTFDANQPGFSTEKFRPHPAAKLLARVYKSDMCALGEGAERRIVRVRKFSDGNVVLDDHNEAGIDKRERDPQNPIKGNSGHSAAKLRAEGFHKVYVDEIGRLLDTGPRREPRK